MSTTKHGTAIEWTHPPGYKGETWNPVTGCTKVSPGCAYCYAEAVEQRFDHDEIIAHCGPRPWALPARSGGRGVTLHLERLEQPLHWKKPRCVFVNSMSDLFHEDVPDVFLPQVFGVMAATPSHIYQVLTKRPERMRQVVNDDCFYDAVEQELIHTHKLLNPESGSMPWPLPNVWLGVSVENQLWADRRIPLLLQTPAVVRFLSCEPLLGPVHIDRAILPSGAICHPFKVMEGFYQSSGYVGPIDWVIAGGESGPDARPMHPDWVRSLRDQCCAAGVPFFFKQWGEWAPVSDSLDTGVLKMAKVGKKAAGAVLDGQEWRQFPSINKKDF